MSFSSNDSSLFAFRSDNDMRAKISLPFGDAAKVLAILKKDSQLLGKLGVMDYRYCVDLFGATFLFLRF